MEPHLGVPRCSLFFFHPLELRGTNTTLHALYMRSREVTVDIGFGTQRMLEERKERP